MLKASDNIPAKGFNIKSNVIAEITKKTANPKEILFQAYDASSNKALWVNGKQSFSVKPTETKGLPLSLIIKATGMYVLFLFCFILSTFTDCQAEFACGIKQCFILLQA